MLYSRYNEHAAALYSWEDRVLESSAKVVEADELLRRFQNKERIWYRAQALAILVYTRYVGAELPPPPVVKLTWEAKLNVEHESQFKKFGWSVDVDASMRSLRMFVIHETAHAVVEAYYGRSDSGPNKYIGPLSHEDYRPDPHGPEFARIVLNEYARFFGMSEEELIAKAEGQVEFGDLSFINVREDEAAASRRWELLMAAKEGPHAYLKHIGFYGGWGYGSGFTGHCVRMDFDLSLAERLSS